MELLLFLIFLAVKYWWLWIWPLGYFIILGAIGNAENSLDRPRRY